MKEKMNKKKKPKKYQIMKKSNANGNMEQTVIAQSCMTMEMISFTKVLLLF